MTRTVAWIGACAGAALVVARLSVAAAPTQTSVPGQMTQAKVWIQNQGQQEAVPVSIVDEQLERPLRVQVTTLPPVARARQLWEYRTVVVKSRDDVVRELNAVGSEGWEATGLQLASSGDTVVLMKRPR